MKDRAPPLLMPTNQLKDIGDLQHALADAALLGFRDNSEPEKGGRAPRTGPALAELLLKPGSWNKPFEKELKGAYLTGWKFKYKVMGIAPPRKKRKK